MFAAAGWLFAVLAWDYVAPLPSDYPMSLAIGNGLFIIVFGLEWAFLALYPRPAPLRSWHGAVALLGMAVTVVAALAWFADKTLLYPDWPGTGRVTVLLHLTIGVGRGAVSALLVLSALVRIRGAPPEERAGAAVLVPLVTHYLLFFWGHMASIVLEATGVRPGAFTGFVASLGGAEGDCCGLPTLVFAVELVGSGAAIAYAASQRLWVPVWLAAIPVAQRTIGLVAATNLTFYLTASLTPLAIVHVLLQKGGLGGAALPRRAADVLGVLALVAVFTAVTAQVATVSATPAGAAIGVLAGLLAGAFAAALVLPPGRTFLGLAVATPKAPEDGLDARQAAYRSALRVLLDAGLDDDALEGRTRPLRSELGITDAEHAALVHALRMARADADARVGLAPGGVFLGRYRVLRLLGRGASGEVWQARDERLGRDVALKRLVENQRRDAAALERFQREMRLASAQAHPNIVAVHDMQVVGEDAYLIMEYMPGGSLEGRLASGPLPDAEARRIAREVLEGLAALHAAGIVHRDVKPSNILLDAQGRAKLGDFTVARAAVSGETLGLTRTGAPVGTPAYMAPEQARGTAATPRSDLYSLGATLYAAIAGEPPIRVDGLSDIEALLKVAQDRPALPLPAAADATNRALARALARDPTERFASADEMARALA